MKTREQIAAENKLRIDYAQQRLAAFQDYIANREAAKQALEKAIDDAGLDRTALKAQSREW